MIKLYELAAAGSIALTQLAAQLADNANTALNLFTIVLVVIAAVPVIKSRRKDAIIKDLEAALHAKDERMVELREELLGAQARADANDDRAHAAEKREAECRAKYDEIQKYTAGPVLVELKEILVDREHHDKTRHDQLLELMARLAGEKSVTDPPPR